MIQFRLGSHVLEMVTLLSFLGEFPFQSLYLLGSERVYKALIVKLTSPERIRNSKTGEEMMCRLFTLTGGGLVKTVRLYRGSLHILDWVHPDAYRYYMDSFWSHHFPGDDLRVAEAVCMRAGMEIRPYLLPKLQNEERLQIVPNGPALYLSRDVKKVSNAELNKTSFTLTVPNWKERILDALFLPETRSYGIGRFEYDACVDGGYVFSHLDGDLNRLIRFKEAIEHIPGPL